MVMALLNNCPNESFFCFSSITGLRIFYVAKVNEAIKQVTENLRLKINETKTIFMCGTNEFLSS